MGQEFTDAELRRVAAYVVVLYLEVERGLRPRESLRRFLSPRAFLQQGSESASLFPAGGVVGQGDVRRMVFQRPTPHRAHVSIPARQEGDRWGALVMELRADPHGVWRVTELTRVQDRNLTTRGVLDAAAPEGGPADVPPKGVDSGSGQQQRSVGNDDMVRAARWAAQDRYDRAARRLATLAPEKPAGQLRPGDVVAVGTGAGQQWVEVSGAVVDETARDVIVGRPDRDDLRIPAEQPVPV